MGKSENYVFCETIAAIGLKVGLSLQINESLQLNEYERLRSFSVLDRRLLRFQI